MSEHVVDVAIVGSTPLAMLLAGLLAAEHGRQVVLVGGSQSGYRLARSIDLSVAPLTRPETWAMLAEGVAYTMQLLGSIGGRGTWSYLNPIFFADTERDREALSHVRHMAQGFRLAVEPVAPSLLGPGRNGILFRDAVRLNRPALEPVLGAWLKKHSVAQLNPFRVSIEADGSGLFRAGEQEITARQTVLVDPEAIINHLPPHQWPEIFRRQACSSILSTRTQPLAAPIMMQIGSGATLIQQSEGGIAAIGPGDLASFSNHIQGLLGRERPVEQAGQTGFITLATADGAPAFGRVGDTGADVVAGLGMTGAFFAPALAGWLAGDAQPHQASWFAARLVTHTAQSISVADFAPGLPEPAA